MTSRNEMILDTNALIADTAHLEALEHGAYMRMLVAMHRSPDGWVDEDSLRKIAGVAPSYWGRVRRALESFLVRQGGRVSQKRILRDRSLPVNASSSLPVKKQAYIESNPLTLLTPSKSEIPESLLPRTDVRSKTRQQMNGWKLGEEEKNYAIDRGLIYADEFEAFKDYHTAKLSRFADWPAAWRTWCRNAVKFSRRNERRGNDKRNGSVVSALDKLIQRADEAAEDSQSGQGTLLGLPDRSVR